MAISRAIERDRNGTAGRGDHPLRKQMRCPHCWHRFRTEDILWVARHEEMRGDPVLGSTFDEILLKFDGDDKTKAVVMTGEIGGVYEERACDAIGKMKTPVLAMIGRMFAPPGKRMGHAGAIVEGKMGTAKEKLEMLADAGAHPCKTFQDIPEVLKKLGV